MGKTTADAASLPPASVIIPTRDRPESVRSAVESVLAGDVLPREIIVADQSSGSLAPLPESEEVEIVRLLPTVPGTSRGRNAGIAAARCEVLVIIDDDVEVERDWLRMLVGALVAKGERCVVTGSVLAPPAGLTDGELPSLTSDLVPQSYRGRQDRDVLWSGNMATWRATFAEVGLFDERLGGGASFPSAEDNDLGYRLLEAGYEIAFVPEAVVYHVGTRAGLARLRLHWQYGLGQGAFYAKHLSPHDRHMLRRLKGSVLGTVRSLWREAIRGRRAAIDRALYLAGLVSGFVGWRLRYGSASAQTAVPSPRNHT